MSSVLKIESAIEKLSPVEFDELIDWLTRHALRIKNRRDAKLTAIRSTAGCLTGTDGEDFKTAVDEAANQIDAHDW